MSTTELENDSESGWVKVFTNKTSHFVAPPCRNIAELTSEIDLLRSQLQKIKCMHKGNKPPSVHVLGDFNFGDKFWPDRLNKSGLPLSPSEGEILIEITNDYGLEQLVHFPTRERNTLDLIITYHIHSPDRLSDNDIVSGTLKVVIPAPPPLKNLRGRCIDIRKVIYEKGHTKICKRKVLNWSLRYSFGSRKLQFD